MNQGNWIPIDRNIVSLLPRNRKYTKAEAYISLREDLERNSFNPVRFPIKRLSEYARIWRWSKSQVSLFFATIGYKNGSDLQKLYEFNNETKNETPICIISSNLAFKEKTNPKQKCKQKKNTTNNTNNTKKGSDLKVYEIKGEILL